MPHVQTNKAYDNTHAEMKHDVQDTQSDPVTYRITQHDMRCPARSLHHSLVLHPKQSKRYSLRDNVDIQRRPIKDDDRIQENNMLPLDASTESELLGILKHFVRAFHPLNKPIVHNAYFSFRCNPSDNDEVQTDVRRGIAQAIFQFEQHKQLKESIENGDVTKEKLIDSYAIHDNKHAGLFFDELEVFDKVSTVLNRVQIIRNINPKKPVKVVFIDYERALFERVGGMYSSLFTSLLSSYYKLAIKDNTIYVLLSKQERDELTGQVLSSDIFDMHAFMDAPKGVEGEFGSPSILPKTDLYGLSAEELFKRAVIMQTVRALRTNFNARTVDVIFIGGTQELRSQLSIDAAENDFDSLVQIKPNDVTMSQVMCALGTCDDPMHKELANIDKTERIEDKYPDSRCSTLEVSELHMVTPFNRAEAGPMPVEYSLNSKHRQKHVSNVTIPFVNKKAKDMLGRVTFGDSKYRLMRRRINGCDLLNTLFDIERMR